MTDFPIDATPYTPMLSVRDVAKLLQCSDRHIGNLRRQGRMPPPVKLGAIVRWPRQVIEDWIAAGCPPEAKPRLAEWTTGSPA